MLAAKSISEELSDGSNFWVVSFSFSVHEFQSASLSNGILVLRYLMEFICYPK